MWLDVESLLFPALIVVSIAGHAFTTKNKDLKRWTILCCAMPVHSVLCHARHVLCILKKGPDNGVQHSGVCKDTKSPGGGSLQAFRIILP